MIQSPFFWLIGGVLAPKVIAAHGYYSIKKSERPAIEILDRGIYITFIFELLAAFFVYYLFVSDDNVLDRWSLVYLGASSMTILGNIMKNKKVDIGVVS